MKSEDKVNFLPFGYTSVYLLLGRALGPVVMLVLIGGLKDI